MGGQDRAPLGRERAARLGLESGGGTWFPCHHTCVCTVLGNKAGHLPLPVNSFSPAGPCSGGQVQWGAMMEALGPHLARCPVLGTHPVPAPGQDTGREWVFRVPSLRHLPTGAQRPRSGDSCDSDCVGSWCPWQIDSWTGTHPEAVLVHTRRPAWLLFGGAGPPPVSSWSTWPPCHPRGTRMLQGGACPGCVEEPGDRVVPPGSPIVGPV